MCVCVFTMTNRSPAFVMCFIIALLSFHYMPYSQFVCVCVCVCVLVHVLSCEVSVRFGSEASSSSSEAANQSVTDK